jgi:hypothetical protein
MPKAQVYSGRREGSSKPRGGGGGASSARQKFVAGAPAHHHIVHQVVRSAHGQEDNFFVKFLHDMVRVSTDHCATVYATSMEHYEAFLPALISKV